MACVESVHYHFLQKGEKLGLIKPSKGLRQGDPLSPFLFILCVEGLSSSIQPLGSRGLIHGCSIARGAPVVTHLFLVDDSYLFFRANEQASLQVKNGIMQYEKASGQVITFDKSAISFSSNVPDHTKGGIRDLFSVKPKVLWKIPRLPSIVGRNKKATFAYVKERIWIKLRIGTKKPYQGPRKRFSSNP